MPFEPIFEDINLLQRKSTIKDRIKVECKTEVPSDGVSKILSVTGRAFVTKVEATKTEICYEGRATFFACYLTEEGEIKKSECATDFKGSVKTDNQEGCRAVAFAQVEKSEADISGVRLGLSGYLLIESELTECNRVRALTGGNNLITDGKEVSVLRSYGLRETTFAVEEQFDLNYPVEEVLGQRAEAVVTAVQCGVGTIIVDGEVLLSAMLLQNREKNDIIRENKILPFRAEIECEDAMPSMNAVAFASEKSFKTDISVDKQNDTSMVNLSVILALSGEVYSSENLTLASDAFSETEKVEIEKEEYPFVKPCDVVSQSKEVTVSISTDALPVGTTLIACMGERVEMVGIECLGDGLLVSGVLNVNAFFRDADGRVFTRKVEGSFETTLDCVCDKECEYYLRAVAHKFRLKLVSSTQLDATGEIFFTAYPYEKACIGVVKGVKSGGGKELERHAISVYIPCEGEELWSLAKRLNVCPDKLLASNQDLQFPLSGKERIVVYRQK